jgi:hypothetical protein
MKLSRLILICITVFVTNKLYGCECNNFGSLDSLRQISYDYSDIVFLGELIDYDTTDYSYTFKIIEVFKGVSDSIFINGKIFNSCSRIPEDKCKWIVYADFVGSDYIDISQCLASRSELNPAFISCYEIPPPIRSKATENKIKKFNEQIEELYRRAKTDWDDEIELLRKRKLE